MDGWALLFIAAIEAVWGFFAWRALRTGEMPTFRMGGGSIRRADNPSAFWSSWIILVLMIVYVGLVTAVLHYLTT